MTSLSAVNSRNLPVLSKDMAEKKLGQNDFLRLMTTQLKERRRDFRNEHIAEIHC
jgi:flagellar basal-body rod modification protein FlgD